MKIITQKFFWAFALVLTGIAWIFGLFIDLTGDSGLYAAITRQMVESGDWFNLQINGKPYDQKPHLFFWLAGAGVKLLGNTNFAFKLFPFLYALLAIYFTYRLGKSIYSKKTGMLATLFAGSSQISFLYFFDFHMDSILQTGIVLALWQLAEYLKHKKPINFVGGFIGVGLAMFTKGPIGAVIPFFAVLFYLVAENDFKQLLHLKWILGIVLALLIVSPTLIHLFRNFGIEGLKFYFITNNFGRITGEYAGSNTDPVFYIHTLLWALLPWTIFVVAAIWTELRSWIKNDKQNGWGYYLLGSTLILLLILSIAKGKAPNYFLIAVAPVSVITGKWFEEKAKGFKIALIRIHWITVALYSILLLIVAFLFTQNYIVCLFIILISCLFILFRVKRNIDYKILLISFTIAACLNLVFNGFVAPRLFEYQAARRVLAFFNENKKPGDKLYNYHSEDYELFYYASDSVLSIQNSEDYQGMLENRGTWLHTIDNGYNELLNYTDIDTVYFVPYKGMNGITLKFLNPKTRKESMDTTYLIKIN